MFFLHNRLTVKCGWCHWTGYDNGIEFCTRVGMFPWWRAISGLNEHLLATGLHHVDILADLLKGHLGETNHLLKLGRHSQREVVNDR